MSEPMSRRTLLRATAAGSAAALAAGTPAAAGTRLDLVAGQGGLDVFYQGVAAFRLVFYRQDHVLVRAPDGTSTHTRSDFLRGPDGTAGWLRTGGRLFRRGGVAAARATGPRRLPRPGTLPHPADS